MKITYNDELDITTLKSYDIIIFTCHNCGEQVEIQKRKFTNLLCRKCKLKEKRNNGSYDNAIKKAKETCKQKYGTEYYTQSKSYKDNVKKQTLEKYGVESYLCSDEFKKKREKSLIEKYGSIEAFYEYQNKKSEETFKSNHEIDKGTFLSNAVKEKYGCNVQQVKDIREKTKNTCLNKYGHESPLGNKNINKKSHDTFLSRYGVKSTFSFDDTREKSRKTMLEKYGVEFPGFSYEIMKKAHGKYTYDNMIFDSSWELAYYIWLKDKNISFEYHPDIKYEFFVNGKIHYCFPDFKVGNSIIELKGCHFVDSSGNWQNPYDKSLNEIYEAKRQCLIKNNVEIITNCDKQLKYVKNKYGKDFFQKCKNNNIDVLAEYWSNQPFPYYNEIKNTSYMSIIRYFHKSIWEANKNGLLSPIDIWKNKSMIKNVIKNRMQYSEVINEDTLRRGICVYYKAKVSVFNPSLAVKIIEKYLNNFNEIFDPFSGFSGRLLGAFNCGKTYIGQDLNENHVKESNDIIDYLKIKNSYVSVKDILNDCNKNYECLFTCPPYGNKEHWNVNDVNKSCDEWIDICLEKYKCEKYVFVVDKTEKYKNYIVETLKNRDMYGESNECIVVI